MEKSKAPPKGDSRVNKSNNETYRGTYLRSVQGTVGFLIIYGHVVERRAIANSCPCAEAAVVYVPPRTSSRAKLRLRARSGG